MAGKRMRAAGSPPPTGPTRGGLRHAQKAADAARQRPAGVCHQKAQRSFTQRAKFTPNLVHACSSTYACNAARNIRKACLQPQSVYDRFCEFDEVSSVVAGPVRCSHWRWASPARRSLPMKDSSIVSTRGRSALCAGAGSTEHSAKTRSPSIMVQGAGCMHAPRDAPADCWVPTGRVGL